MQAVVLYGRAGGDLRMSSDGKAGISGDVVLLGYDVANARRVLVTDAIQKVSSNLANRRKVRILNLDSNDIYLGFSDAATTGDAYVVFAGTWEEFDFGQGIDIYLFRAAVGTSDTRMLEVGVA